MSAASYALWLLFPKRCAVCNKTVPRGIYVCKECMPTLKFAENLCMNCGNAKNECACRHTVYRFKASVSPLLFNDASKAIIANFKFADNSDIADFLAEKMAESVNNHYKDVNFDYVAFVPATAKRKFSKGYNQSEILAQKISKAIDVPLSRSLIKLYGGKQQHSLNRSGRFSNVKNLFECKGNLDAENVLLVDDIKTTGATLNECTRALMYAGVKNVYCITAVTNSKYIEK